MQAVGGFGGGNITLLVGDEKVVLIDDAMVPTAPALLAAVLQTAGRPVDFVINTHVHGDHVGGNALLQNSGSVIFAHDNIRKRLEADPTDAGGPDGLPVVTFSDTVTFHVNDLTAYVFHVEQAHTDGDAAIHFGDVNVIHAGDLFFHKLFPYIDLDNGGTVDGYIAGQERLLSMADDDTVILPGHGDVATKAGLREDLDMLIDAKGRVTQLVEEGKTIEEALEINPLADYHDVYNWGFITTERMTRILFRDLSGENS
jgi:glyoxylase-like metal-dependent hydrolase (beta-lactamase superfamily II)